jgi:GNAT superfamily N-acetyltransferase
MNWRMATKRDSRLLAEMNHQLIADEGHRNPTTVPQLEARMRQWLEEGYDAALFEKDGETAAYALYLVQSEEVYLRHFFVVRHRRRQGIGREAMGLLRARLWPAACLAGHGLSGLLFDTGNAAGRGQRRASVKSVP